MPQIQPKPSFDEFIRSCTPLLRIPELEASMRQKVQGIVSELLNFQPHQDPALNLKEFLRKDKSFLGVLLALTNLSQEKFLRIISAQRFATGDFDVEWNVDTIYKKMKTDDDFSQKIATLFLDGRHSQLLQHQIADFYLDQLSLPVNWSDVIKDQNLIGNIVRRKLTGEYTDNKGEFVERTIRQYLDTIFDKYGITHTKGQVKVMSLGKEVDHVIPNCVDPYVLVMVSYMETTSSNQTTRANEQQAMYQKIIGENVRRVPIERVLVNVVDGAGWLARRSDLRKMHAGCHFCLSIKSLNQLEAIICKYVPQQYFTRQPKPSM